MSKYILIDLEDTITIHKKYDRLKELNVKWLEYNNVLEPLKIYNNPKFKNRATRMELLGIREEEYPKWYKNFSDVEFNMYVDNYNNNEITIPKSAKEFLKKINIPLILVSNSAPKWIDYILEKENIKKYFKYIFRREYTVDDIKKPDAKVIDIIQNDIKEDISKDSIVVGDSKSDFDFAKNCNLEFISMYNKFENCLMCKDFYELLKVLKKQL